MVLGIRRFLLPLMLLARMACMCHDDATPASAPLSSASAPVASSSAAVPLVAPVPVDPSPFHDAVISYADPPEAMLPNALTLCPFEGRTFVCGVSDVPLVSTESGVENDATREAGTAPPVLRRVHESAGAWPASALLLATEPGASTVHAFRYANGGWTPFNEWQSRGVGLAAAWERDLLVTDVAVRPDVLDGATFTLRRAGRDGGLSPPPVSRVMTANDQVATGRASPLVALGSRENALFMAVRRGSKLVVERHVDGDKAPVALRVDGILDVGPSAPLTARLWVRGVYDAVIFGEAGDDAGIFFRRFDGERWIPVIPPEGTTRVMAYDRTISGLERVFVEREGSVGLYERSQPTESTTDAWRAVLLPTLPPGDRVHGVWLANDDAWVLVWPRNMREHPAHLMRLSPVARVWTYRD